MATELLIQMYKTEVNYKKYYAYDIFIRDMIYEEILQIIVIWQT